MIGWISGTVRSKSENTLIVDVAGVGYEVHIPMNIGSISVGAQAEFHIHTHVREDALVLFGFAHLFEKEVFLQLITVSGVGPKTALGILSKISAADLVDIIRTQNMMKLQSIQGIGKKTAERLVVELKDKMKTLSTTSTFPARHKTTIAGAAEEVVSALVNLGYKPLVAEDAVSQIDLSNFSTFDRILKESLKLLSK